MEDKEIRIITLMEENDLTEDEARMEVIDEDRVDAAVAGENMTYETASGESFEEIFQSTPSFQFLIVEDEVHAPGDLLDTYSKTFQQNVELLRKEEDPDKLSKKGKMAYDNRHRMTTKEWNFWSVEYRLKKNRLLVITSVGEKAISQLRQTLDRMPEEGIRAYGRDLHRLCEKSTDGLSVLTRKGLNSVEINALWTVWREFSGQRPEHEGIDFIIE